MKRRSKQIKNQLKNNTAVAYYSFVLDIYFRLSKNSTSSSIKLIKSKGEREDTIVYETSVRQYDLIFHLYEIEKIHIPNDIFDCSFGSGRITYTKIEPFNCVLNNIENENKFFSIS